MKNDKIEFFTKMKNNLLQLAKQQIHVVKSTLRTYNESMKILNYNERTFFKDISKIKELVKDIKDQENLMN